MENKVYNDELDESKYKYNKMVLVNIIQSVAIIVLTGGILFFAMNQKTILKSPYPTNKDEIIGSGFEDQEKLTHFAHYITNLTQNITYSNADKQLLFLLPLLESSNFNEVKKSLKLEALYVMKNKITQNFYISNIDVDQEQKIIKVKGTRERRVGGQVLKNKNNGYETVILTINYKLKYGTYLRLINLKVEKTK
jgi:type IV conjugative transfer system protein TraE